MKTVIMGEVVETTSKRGSIEEGYRPVLRNSKLGRDVIRIYDCGDGVAFVFATSPASRCGDEEPVRDFVAVDELKRAGLLPKKQEKDERK